MQIHELKPLNKLPKKKRIGRGGKRGNYCGRGLKGQRSRAGAKIKPHLREVINKFPKKRGEGFKVKQDNVITITFQDLERLFPQGGKITPQILKKAGLGKKSATKQLKVKILAKGELKNKYDIKDCFVSKKAQEAIIKAGGTIQINQEK